MLRAYKYRIYPNKEQGIQLAKNFGCARYIYNWGLQRKIEDYTETGKRPSYFTLANDLPALKKEYMWLKEADAQVLQMELRNLDNAFTKFFREKKGFPIFKSKHSSRQSCQYPQRVEIRDGKLRLPKIGLIKIKLNRTFEGKIKTSTVSRDLSGKYYISLLVEDGKDFPEIQPFTEETTIGVDIGLAHFATLSTGEKIEHPKYLTKAEKKLKRTQRILSRRKKRSNNRKKARVKLAVQHEKVKAKRHDFLHKLSRRLIDENQAVAIETLNIEGMLKNRRLAKYIGSSGWGTFFTFLDYKSKWYGKSILEIGQFDPSSKTCHVCGKINQELKLRDRKWTCKRCTTEHDRDINAAKNIKHFALAEQNLIVPRGTRELTLVEIA